MSCVIRLLSHLDNPGYYIYRGHLFGFIFGVSDGAAAGSHFGFSGFKIKPHSQGSGARAWTYFWKHYLAHNRKINEIQSI